MQVYELTACDFGKEKILEFDGHVEIEGCIGLVVCKSLIAKGNIIIGKGTSIKAGMFIESGGFIVAGGFIKADGFIVAGGFIKADGFIESRESIEAGWFIVAGGFIKADGTIVAGASIEARGSIVGMSIKAGASIKACLCVSCIGNLEWSLQLFAGTCTWRRSTAADRKITCGKAKGGTVEYGELTESESTARV